jgi:DNA-binding beta-propeller fold protein YncE
MNLRYSLIPLVTASLLGAQASPPPPTNDAPNPFRTVEGWAKMPEGRAWGSTSAVDIDKDGVSIWVAERCGVNSCAGSNLDPILKFDATGKLVKSFGAGLINFPHGIHVDRDGNIWVTDGQDNRPRRGRGAAADAPMPAAPAVITGHQIFKFSPDGKLLLTMGAKGGDTATFFWQPNDILVAPDGHIFVAEGHSSSPGSRARVIKFDRNGKIVKTFGSFGKGEGQMDQPHALALDSRGRLFVGDRGNNRIQIWDQDGKLLDTWYQFSRPSGIWIDRTDVMYVADSESAIYDRDRAGGQNWLRGIRIGSARDGRLTAFIPDPNPGATSTSAAEGVAVDSKGVIYGAEVGPRALKRYERKP